MSSMAMTMEVEMATRPVFLGLTVIESRATTLRMVSPAGQSSLRRPRFDSLVQRQSLNGIRSRDRT